MFFKLTERNFSSGKVMEFHVLQIPNLWNYPYVSDSRLRPFRSCLPARATKVFKERLSSNELVYDKHRRQTILPMFRNYSKYNKRLITDNRHSWENIFLRTDKKKYVSATPWIFSYFINSKTHSTHVKLLPPNNSTNNIRTN